MIHSIRQRLFLSVSLLIGFFVLISWVMNTNYLQTYYTAQKTAQLRDEAESIDKLFNDPPQDIYWELELLERREGISILVLNESLEMEYKTLTRRPNEHRFDMVIGRLPMLRSGEVVEEITKDPFNDARSLNLYQRLSNGYYLILSTPLASIQESAAVANTFFLYTGIITLLLATIVIFFFARRFTRPILELNDIAQHMARLDFSKTYNVSTADELGQLGQSINSMSEQLSKAIGDLQEANAHLREDIEKERRLDEMRKEFVSNVSHELKTPIALIQGYAEGLKVNVVEDQAEKDFYCSVIIDEANKMNKLVKELLDLSQVEAGVFRLEKTQFDLSALLDRVIAKYKPIFEEKQVCLEVYKDDTIPVHADSIRTEQILTNYINNALNHLDSKRLLKIDTVLSADKIRVSVINSGEPIPDVDLDKIFTSFYKVDRARTRSYGGTGLGLAVVRAIQEKDGNLYGVENLPDGVRFWFDVDIDLKQAL